MTACWDISRVSKESAAFVAPKNGYAVLLKSVAGINISVIGTDVYVSASVPATFMGYFAAQVFQDAVGIFKCCHIITKFADKVSETAMNVPNNLFIATEINFIPKLLTFNH